MTSRKPLTAADFVGTNGCRVRLGGEAVISDAFAQRPSGVLVLFDGESRRVLVPHRAIAEILPEEIGVGDKVRHYDGRLGTVSAIDDEHCAVVCARMEGGKARFWWPAANCTLVRKAKP